VQHRACDAPWLVLLLVATPALLHGQAPDQKPLAFEVASVKRNTSGEVGGSEASGALGTHVRESNCTACAGIDRGPGTLRIGCMTMKGLADAFSGEVGRAVLDMTGVTGRFGAEVQWMPDRAAVDLATPSNAQRFSRLSKSSLFTAVTTRVW
jgi:Protein of unknown function (DUF3738)